ncbi:MAG: NAD-dependent epimerase/dehydratase family protein [Crocinitomicaceae bacterium]|nr:NAD-dependent epimerase/dehydratase family protein [Crocinitomicaceae bacterium]
MKVLVTGPDGLLGNNLIRELLKRGYKVKAMTEKSEMPRTFKDLEVEQVQGNLLDKVRMQEVTRGVDYVIHCAAHTGMFPARSEIVNRVNIEGTQNIIRGCLKNNVKRLIVVGSANSFGPGCKENPGNENRTFEGAKYKLDYIDSKYMAKNLVLDAVRNDGLDALVVSPTFMIGPYDSRPSSGTMILKVVEKKIPGYTLGGKNFVAVKDVAVGIANALTMGRKGECYILGNENLTYKEAFEKIAAAVQVKSPRIKLSTRVVIAMGWLNSTFAKLFRYQPGLTYELAKLSVGDHYYSSEKAKRELDFPQTPIEVAIKECRDWFVSNGYIKQNK